MSSPQNLYLTMISHDFLFHQGWLSTFCCCFSLFIFSWRIIAILYWFLPYINMDQSQVYICPFPLEPPSLFPSPPTPPPQGVTEPWFEFTESCGKFPLTCCCCFHKPGIVGRDFTSHFAYSNKLVSCQLTLKLLPVILYLNSDLCIRWSVLFNKAWVWLLCFFFFSVEMISTGPSTMFLSSSWCFST